MIKQLTTKIILLRSNAIEKTNMTQKMIFFGVFGTLLVSVIGGLMYKGYASTTGEMIKKEGAPRSEKRIKIESGGSVLNPQEIWVDRLEKEQALLNKRLSTMEKILDEIAKGTLASRQHVSVQTENVPALGISEANMLPPHNILDPRGLQSNTSQQSQAFMPLRSVSDPVIETSDRSREKTHDQKGEKPLKFQRVIFNLDPLSSKKIKKSIDHYVPAGSFVRGRLTSGVVAPTSVQASSNPQPIHIELTNLGNLPRGFKTDVKQCFLIGSAYGDLSSERVLMRLETLSCVERKTEEIIEMNVDGFVTGEDGANGLRGIVVDRTGPAMRSAFVGGFLSGVGNFFGQQQTSVPTMISPGGVASVNPLAAQHMLQGGAGKGVGNAMEKLSECYIKRAEQLQPVLEVEPGRLVHVVFKKGFDMNQTVYRQSLMTVKDHSRRDVAERVGTDTKDEPHL